MNSRRQLAIHVFLTYRQKLARHLRPIDQETLRVRVEVGGLWKVPSRSLLDLRMDEGGERNDWPTEMKMRSTAELNITRATVRGERLD